MNRFFVTVGLVAVFMVGSVVAILANATPLSAGSAGSSAPSIVRERSADRRLLLIDQELYPGDAAPLDDWLCDGMTLCVELSPRQPN